MTRAAVGRASGRVRSIRRHWDVLVAAALVTLAFVPGAAQQGVELAELSGRPMDALGWVLLVVQGASVALLRRWPVVSLAAAGTAFGAYEVLGYPTTVAALGVLATVVGAGALVRRRRWVVAACAAAGYVLLALASAWAGSPTSALDYVVFGMLLAGLWVLGSWLRARSEAQELRRRASERAAVERERSRIARDLHDVITHHVTAMVIQADAAQVGTLDGERTAAVLSTIGETGREALADLRRLLVALDGSEDDESEDATPRADPFAAVAESVDRARAAGQPVEYRHDGVARPLPAEHAWALVRVVQEGLTNAMKHAAGAATRVRVREDEQGIEVIVTTETAGRPGLGRGSGQGLRGLRERLEQVGGDLESGPVEGGFVVRARIPA